MKRFPWVVRMVIGTMLTLAGLVLLLNFLYMLSPFGGYDLLFAEVIGGFWFFLRENFPAISWDAGTWGPGLGAFLLATIIAHRFIAAWAARTNRYWSFATSLCLVLAVPVLFVIAFIVPGVLLQWEMLRQVPWIDVH